jgi:pimeloyl-ACP methyl ester carboxylesterase
MKNIKFIIGIIALCWLPLSIFGQVGVTSDRTVNFLHGLGGNATDWEGFTDFFRIDDNRRINVRNLGFTSAGGFAAITTAAGNQSLLGSDNIAICHSMGGVIARRIDRAATTPNQTYGGIITVGSPLDGAPIANSVSNGSVGRAIADANYALSRGPFASIFPDFGVQVFGNFFGAVVLPGMLEQLLGPSSFGNDPATLRDLGVGGNGIEADKNATSTNTPKISIWGNEDGPIHWNILATNAGSAIPTIADVLGYAYLAAGITYTAIAAINWYNPYGWYSAYVAYQWYAGYDWIANDSERIYNNLIGSDMVVEQCYQTLTQFIVYDNECDDIPSRWKDCKRTVQTATVTNCVQVHNNGISDAFIPALSQRGEGSRSWRTGGGQTVPTREAMHTNHFEELQPQSVEMRAIFNEIFTGAVDPVFRVDRR